MMTNSCIFFSVFSSMKLLLNRQPSVLQTLEFCKWIDYSKKHFSFLWMWLPWASRTQPLRGKPKIVGKTKSKQTKTLAAGIVCGASCKIWFMCGVLTAMWQLKDPVTCSLGLPWVLGFLIIPYRQSLMTEVGCQILT